MPSPLPSRRQAIAMAAGLAASAPLAAAAMDLRTLAPLGFQAHSLRVALARDFPGTLRVMKAMGYDMIELASFPGFAGDRRGDFGPLPAMPPAEVRKTIVDAGLTATSGHFLAHEFLPDRFERSLAWAKAVGLTHMVYAGLELPAQPTLGQLGAQLDLLNQTGARVRAAGLKMGFHSDAHVWRTIEGRSAVEEMMRRLAPENVAIQMDFGTIVQSGADGAAILERWPDRFFSVHLRDAKRPDDPNAYLPAAPLGTGDVAWAPVLRAARRAGVRHYVVEMTRYPGGILDALKESRDYLARLEV